MSILRLPSIIAALLIASSLSYSSNANAQIQVVNGDLQITIGCSARRCLPYQACVLELRWRNLGTSTINAPAGLFPTEGWNLKRFHIGGISPFARFAPVLAVSAYGAHPDSQWPVHHYLGHMETVNCLSLKLPPLHEFVVELPYGRMNSKQGGMPAFSTPGDFTFEYEWDYALMSQPCGKCRSEPVVVRVEETTGVDKDVCNVLATEPKIVEMMLHADIPHRDDQIEKTLNRTQELLSNYMNSSYADYWRFLLARKLLFTVNYTSGESSLSSKRQDVERGLAALDAINLETFPYGASVLALKRWVSVQQNNQKAAQAWAKELDQKFPYHFARLQDYYIRVSSKEWLDNPPFIPRPIKDAVNSK